MISKDLLEKIELIRIFTRKTVTDVFSGEYESAFKGRGIEFEEVREYLPGDDIRSIDWNVTARTGTPYIKRFKEERELTILFMVDLSGSGRYGSGRKSRNEVAAEIVAVLSFAAVNNNDKIGLIVFTETVEMFVPAKKGNNHMLRMVRDLLAFKPEGRGTSIKNALEYLGKITRRKAVVFLLSDFLDSGYGHLLRITAKRHDLVTILLSDPGERKLPRAGLVDMEDAETGEIITVDTSNPAAVKAFEERYIKRRGELQRFFRSAGADNINIETDSEWIHTLSSFFLSRERRK